MENNRPMVGVGVIVMKDNKVLLGKRKGDHGNNLYGFPGGHLEFGEEIIDCAKRETLEETNIEVQNEQIIGTTNDIFKDKNKHYITIFVLCEYKNGEVTVMEKDKCESWDWIEWDKIPENIFLPIKNLQKQGYHPFK